MHNPAYYWREQAVGNCSSLTVCSPYNFSNSLIIVAVSPHDHIYRKCAQFTRVDLQWLFTIYIGIHTHHYLNEGDKTLNLFPCNGAMIIFYCVNWYYSLAFLVKSHNSTSLWNNTMNLFMRLFLYEAINCLYPHGQLLYSIWVLRYEKTTYCKSISNQHGDIWRTITSTKSCISKLLDTNIVTGGCKRFHEKNPRPKFLTWHWHTDMHGQNMPW